VIRLLLLLLPKTSTTGMKLARLARTLVTPRSVGFALLAAAFFVSQPQSASALSCLNPTEMIPTYVTDESYIIAHVTAGTLETEGDLHEQEVAVQAVYKGELNSTQTVQFAHDETWNYLCAGAPADSGSESLYILQGDRVIQSLGLDTELAQTLRAELGEPNTPNQEPVDTNQPEETERQSLMKQVINLLQQIIALLGGTVEAPAPTPIPQSYIGLTPTQAANYAASVDELFRVVEIDGAPQAVTKDYRPGRINAVVQNGVVTTYTIEGQETPVEETGDYIGLTVENAQARAEAQGVAFRLGTIDGQPRPLTMDYRPGRITATVENNIVVDYSVEGDIQ
jgi:hypothetical protein